MGQMPTTLVPPPIHGERLSRSEFERRYEAHPEIFRAELLDGIVFIHANRRKVANGRVAADLIGWAVHYKVYTPGCEADTRTSTRVGADSEVQPDVSLGILGSCGGRLYGPKNDYRPEPAELLVEIVDRLDHKTLSVKHRLYAAAGVREFVTAGYLERAIEWFRLDNRDYSPMARDADGVIRSETFPGLWLNVPAFFRDEGARMFATLQQGLQSPEHARFVAELQARRTS
jgi:Uma2 family endonuclease